MTQTAWYQLNNMRRWKYIAALALFVCDDVAYTARNATDSMQVVDFTRLSNLRTSCASSL